MSRPERKETAPGVDAAINLNAPSSGDGCRDCELATPPAPTSHPASQPIPGPSGRVPLDWRRQLH